MRNYEMADGSWDYTREEADRLQEDMEQQGRAVGKSMKRYKALRKAGKLVDAANACRHGWIYPLASIAAKDNHDPRQGQTGVRCVDCGSVVTDMHGTVIHPCELEGN